MSTKLEVWGDYACFTRPELKTERVSYPVMTPSAARGIIDYKYYMFFINFPIFFYKTSKSSTF